VAPETGEMNLNRKILSQVCVKQSYSAVVSSKTVPFSRLPKYEIRF